MSLFQEKINLQKPDIDSATLNLVVRRYDHLASESVEIVIIICGAQRKILPVKYPDTDGRADTI